MVNVFAMTCLLEKFVRLNYALKTAINKEHVQMENVNVIKDLLEKHAKSRLAQMIVLQKVTVLMENAIVTMDGKVSTAQPKSTNVSIIALTKENVLITYANVQQVSQEKIVQEKFVHKIAMAMEFAIKMEHVLALQNTQEKYVKRSSAQKTAMETVHVKTESAFVKQLIQVSHAKSRNV